MSAPKSYLTNYDKVCEYLMGLKIGEVKEIARSPGDRPLHAVSYGEFEPIDRKADFGSALATDAPEAFFGTGRKKQVLLISSAVHGAEMESIAGVMNLIALMETGRDLDGVEWPRLTEYASQLRLVIVPIANPDGRARIDSDDPVSWTEDEMEKYRHGLDAEGKPNGWMPGCFVPHPRPSGADSFLGGTFNDAGVNPSHGAFLDRSIAPETHAIIDLAYDETADCYLDLHSCGAGPFFIVGYGFIPPEMSARQSHFDGTWRTKMRARGLPAPTWTTRSKRKSIAMAEYVYHKAGSLPLLFEGGSGSRYRGDHVHRQIIETYLLLFEAVCEIGVEEGFK